MYSREPAQMEVILCPGPAMQGLANLKINNDLFDVEGSNGIVYP